MSRYHYQAEWRELICVSKKKNINISDLINVTNDEDLPALKPLKKGVSSHVDSNSRIALEGLTNKQYMRNTGDINNGRILGTKPWEHFDRIINQQKAPTDMFSKSQTDDWSQHQLSGVSDFSLKSDVGY
ncbi:hypothetical protein ZOSMA_82G00360 [Zostera marina]|uniref:Uncharacterized protein n=1 Tax=Zostera marina TaxID=29655 RepID=A0A0K9NLT0_ZOSMR|nr:hypothetical protein ZOSMA_82G00360 [Zostera marina]